MAHVHQKNIMAIFRESLQSNGASKSYMLLCSQAYMGGGCKEIIENTRQKSNKV